VLTLHNNPYHHTDNFYVTVSAIIFNLFTVADPLTGCEHNNNDAQLMMFTIFLCFRQDVPVLLFVMFCSEGDNVQDAIDIAQKLNGFMNIIGRAVCIILSSFLLKIVGVCLTSIGKKE
jgi:hypothetical protein